MKKFKNYFCLFVSVVLIFVVTGCSSSEKGNDNNIGSNKRVLSAIEAISDYWDKDYNKNKIEDKYLKIINTKIIHIKDNIDSKKIFDKGDLFDDVDYIIEFELLSNYFDTAPYYQNVGTNNCVIVYKDGSADVQKNPLALYRTTTYSSDFSPIIESVEDLDAQYNHIIKFE